MKKLIAILAVIFTCSATAAFADSNRIVDNAIVKENFNRAFKGVANASWYETKDGYAVKFSMNSSDVIAYFDKSGKLQVTSRRINDAALPLDVMKSLFKEYPDQDIRNVVELTTDTDTLYVIMLESKTKWTSLRVSANGDIRVMESLKKA